MSAKKRRVRGQQGLVSLRQRLNGATAVAAGIAALGFSAAAWAQTVQYKASDAPSVTYSGGTSGAPKSPAAPMPTAQQPPAEQPSAITTQSDAPQSNVQLNGGVAEVPAS